VELHDGNAFVLAAISASDRLELHKLRTVLDTTKVREACGRHDP